jgi:hypothetical protein
VSTTIRVEKGLRTAWVYGPGRIVVPAMKLTRTRRQWDDNRRAWTVPIGQLSEVLAAIEDRIGGDVELVQVTR